MKRRNFPGRREQRRIDAQRNRALPYTLFELARVEAARQIRTKKRP